MAAFLGMRGTGDFPSGWEPESWQEQVMFEQPNGSAPLFAWTSMFGKETVDSDLYHWFTYSTPVRAIDLTAGSAIYLDTLLSTAYVYATHQATRGIAGATLYVKVTEDFAKQVRTNSTVILRDSSNLAVDVIGKVTGKALNGASSYLSVELLEADDNGSSSENLATVDRIIVKASVEAQGSLAPAAISYEETKWDNATQIIRRSLNLTGTAMANLNRTGNNYQRELRKTRDLYSMDWEMNLLYSVYRLGTGDNGKRQYSTYGLIPWMRANNGTNIRDYYNSTASPYAGSTWLQEGETFLDTAIRDLNLYLQGESMWLCGDGALDGINKLAKTYGQVNLKSVDVSYGIRVVEWVTPHGVAYFKTHPLLSYEASTRNMAIGCHPRNIKLCPLVGNGENRDIKLEENVQLPGEDARTDAFRGELGTKFFFENQFMILYGVGQDNITA